MFTDPFIVDTVRRKTILENRLAGLFLTMATSQMPCTLTLADGTHYDLSSLASAKADYTAEVGETSYKLNVCRGVVSELFQLDDPDTIGGFYSRSQGDFSLG